MALCGDTFMKYTCESCGWSSDYVLNDCYPSTGVCPDCGSLVSGKDNPYIGHQAISHREVFYGYGFQSGNSVTPQEKTPPLRLPVFDKDYRKKRKFTFNCPHCGEMITKIVED